MLRPNEISFIGLENYLRLFQDDAVGFVFFQTIAMVLVTVPPQIVISIGLARILSLPQLKGRLFLRTMFFFPSIIPSIAILSVVAGFLDPVSGWLNLLIIEPLGLDGLNNLYSEGFMQMLLAINSLWAIGPGLLIILGALQGIPQDIQEAAKVDGAGPFTQLFTITLPMISPAIFFSLVINLVMAFGGVVLLDRGNRFSGSNSPVDGYITNIMFQRYNFGYAASLSWVFLITILVFIYIIFKTSDKWVFFPDREN